MYDEQDSDSTKDKRCCSAHVPSAGSIVQREKKRLGWQRGKEGDSNIYPQVAQARRNPAACSPIPQWPVAPGLARVLAEYSKNADEEEAVTLGFGQSSLLLRVSQRTARRTYLPRRRSNQILGACVTKVRVKLQKVSCEQRRVTLSSVKLRVARDCRCGSDVALGVCHFEELLRQKAAAASRRL